MRDEVNYALDQSDIIVPVLYRPCDIPFRLLRIQHIEFAGDYDSALDRLKERLIGQSIKVSKITGRGKTRLYKGDDEQAKVLISKGLSIDP